MRRRHLFIVGAVEDPDFPARGHAAIGAPQKIMRDFSSGWRLEGKDFDALRVHAGHDVLDGSAFACGVHRPKNQ